MANEETLRKHDQAVALCKEKRFTEALPLLEELSDNGYAASQCCLGECYYRGFGVTQNYPKAYEYFVKAAQQGNAIAQYNTGVCFLRGQGTERNGDKGAEWLKRASDQGIEQAKKLLKEIDRILSKKKKKFNIGKIDPDKLYDAAFYAQLASYLFW